MSSRLPISHLPMDGRIVGQHDFRSNTLPRRANIAGVLRSLHVHRRQLPDDEDPAIEQQVLHLTPSRN